MTLSWNPGEGSLSWTTLGNPARMRAMSLVIRMLKPRKVGPAKGAEPLVKEASWKASEMRDYLRSELGPDWEDYFYPEFPMALTPQTWAHDYMAKLQKEGWTPAELANHPVYGLFVNIAEYHPAIARLGRLLDPSIPSL